MRLRITSKHFSTKTHDLGGGFYVTRERNGTCNWYFAMLLDAPGGYVVNRMYEKFSYYREAEAQVQQWKQLLEVPTQQANRA